MYGHMYMCLLTFGKKIKTFKKNKNKNIQKIKTSIKIKKKSKK
jgi:hypothetical protein